MSDNADYNKICCKCRQHKAVDTRIDSNGRILNLCSDCCNKWDFISTLDNRSKKEKRIVRLKCAGIFLLLIFAHTAIITGLTYSNIVLGGISAAALMLLFYHLFSKITESIKRKSLKYALDRALSDFEPPILSDNHTESIKNIENIENNDQTEKKTDEPVYYHTSAHKVQENFRCGKCGKKLMEGSTFCMYCGADFSDS